MKILNSTLLVAVVSLVLLACDGNGDGSKVPAITSDSALVELKMDTLLTDTVVKDTNWHVFPPFSETDTVADSTDLVKQSLDSLYDEIANSVEAPSKTDSNKQIVGKWYVEQKVSGGEVVKGQKKVFAVYHQDSAFTMKAINVLGKWWIEDSLLFQKFELPTKLTVDTSIVHVLNDSILEVEEMRGGDKFIFKKVQ